MTPKREAAPSTGARTCRRYLVYRSPVSHALLNTCSCGAHMHAHVRRRLRPLEAHGSSSIRCRSFFTTTPEEFLSAGLYKKIAVALLPGAHRRVSMMLASIAIGAAKSNTGLLARVISKLCRPRGTEKQRQAGRLKVSEVSLSEKTARPRANTSDVIDAVARFDTRATARFARAREVVRLVVPRGRAEVVAAHKTQEGTAMTSVAMSDATPAPAAARSEVDLDLESSV